MTAGDTASHERRDARDRIPVLATLTVGRRTYRKASRRNQHLYSHPELRLSNRWLARAGLKPGDRVYVASPKPGCLVIIISATTISSDSRDTTTLDSTV